MSDPASDAVAAILHGDLARFPVVMLAGVISSIGPCVAPRYIALASVVNGRRRGWTIIAFVAGIVTAYTALGCAAGLLGEVARNASVLDVILAVALAIAGLVTLLRRSQHHAHDRQCRHGHTSIRDDGSGNERPSPRLSGIFCLGAASALVVSPCCTPIVAAVVAFPALEPSALGRAALLAAFALGHATPLLLMGSCGSLAVTRLQRWTASPAPSVVSGSLMLGLGAYYGALA
jgi:thiol:disulfide interchange protein DsbD